MKNLLFIIQAGLIIAATAWLVQNPGYISVSWFDYKVTIHVGLALIALILFLWCFVYLVRFWYFMMDFPKTWQKYRIITGSNDGIDALTKGYVALASGDSNAALRQVNKAKSALPKNNSHGLVYLLEAQAAKELGDEKRREAAIKNLLKDDSYEILGIRAQVKDLLENGDIEKSMLLIEDAMQKPKLKAKNKQALQEIYYRLALISGQWEKALDYLRLIKPDHNFSKDRIKADRVALLTVLAQNDNDQVDAAKKLKEAIRLDPSFVPANRALIKIYRDQQKENLALSAIKSAWKHNQHPDYIAGWEALIPKSQSTGVGGRTSWYKKLLDKSQTYEGYLALAQVAIDDGLWGEAKSYLQKAEKIKQTKGLFGLWLQLERQTSNDNDKMDSLIERASIAKPDKKWVCSETGRIYQDWAVIAEPHGAFNSINWIDPDQDNISENYALSYRQNLIERYLPKATDI